MAASNFSALASERVRLIPLTAEQLRLAANDPPSLESALAIVITDDVFSDLTRRAIKTKLEKLLNVPLSDHLWLTYWLVVLLSHNTGVGLVGFKGAPDESGQVEIGYGIANSFRGQHIGTEAVRQLIDWAFTHRSCLVVWGDPLKTNVPSIRLLHSCGARQVGETETSVLLHVARPNSD